MAASIGLANSLSRLHRRLSRGCKWVTRDSLDLQFDCTVSRPNISQPSTVSYAFPSAETPYHATRLSCQACHWQQTCTKSIYNLLYKLPVKHHCPPRSPSFLGSEQATCSGPTRRLDEYICSLIGFVCPSLASHGIVKTGLGPNLFLFGVLFLLFLRLSSQWNEIKTLSPTQLALRQQ
jgi:hypothetical protein